MSEHPFFIKAKELSEKAQPHVAEYLLSNRAIKSISSPNGIVEIQTVMSAYEEDCKRILFCVQSHMELVGMLEWCLKIIHEETCFPDGYHNSTCTKITSRLDKMVGIC